MLFVDMWGLCSWICGVSVRYTGRLFDISTCIKKPQAVRSVCYPYGAKGDLIPHTHITLILPPMLKTLMLGQQVI